VAVIADREGRIVWSKAVDLDTDAETSLPAGFETAFAQMLDTASPDDPEWGPEGLLRLPDQLMLVALRPILTTAREGPAAGVLFFGAYLNESAVAALSQTLKLPISIYTLDDSALTAVSAASRDALLADRKQTMTAQVLNDSAIAGYTLLNDVAGEPAALAEITAPRPVFQQGLNTFLLLTLVLVAVGLALSFIIYTLLNVVVIGRITRLSAEVSSIGDTTGATQQVKVESNDEVTTLAHSINLMLNRLDMAQRDIQQRSEALEQAYKEAREATRLKSEFLSTMSHELRTPLNAVIGYAGIMLAGIGGEVDAEARRMIGNIHSSSTHLLTLVNDVLDLSKIEAGRLELVDVDFSLRRLVGDIQEQLQVLADRKAIDFTVEIDEALPDKLRGDEARIGQMITNLLSNAIKFTDEGYVRFKAAQAGDELMITVEDTGIGIPAHALNFIFEEFRQADGTTRRSYQGTGLGLAIVRKLTEAMDGRLNVVSSLGKGSIFTIHLPLRLASTSEQV
jgi:signal transduction histidine kinase